MTVPSIPPPLTPAQRKAAQQALEQAREAALAPIRAERAELDADPEVVERARLRLPPTDVEAAARRALAEREIAALQSDETVPGGAYLVDGRLVDAHGRPLGD